jgi:sulfur carrier protein
MVESFRRKTLVKLILRDKEFEVKPGMTLLSALQKVNVLPESVIATREGEMILEDEILKDGDVIKLIAVISGGAGIGTRKLGIGDEPRITNYDSRRRQP